MQQFTFILKDNTQKAFNSFYWFLFFLHVIASAAMPFKETNAYHRTVGWIFLLMLGLLTFLYPYFKGKIKLLTYQRIVSLIMVCFWIALFAWIPAIVLIIAVVFANFILTRKSMAIFSSDNVVIVKTVFKKKYDWKEIENVVLKDHLLSVDFKNNHLIQIEISAESYAIDEAVFNHLCHCQLIP